MENSFADVLERYVERSGYTLGQIARRTELPKTTIVNWANGTVRKPQQWPDLVKLALQLTLCEAEANELLNSAGHPDIAELMTRTESEGIRYRLRQLMMDRRGYSAPAPFQAIPPPPFFVGRNRELTAIRKALLAGEQVTLCSLEGLAGVGKTALAAQIADQLRPYFYDGVLWAKLDVADPMAILAGIAEAYGYTADSRDMESRATKVRQILATKRALIILDNVQSSEEVRPFLPPRGTSSVLITTRRRDLSVARSAARFVIEPFDERSQEALDLFSKILGAQVIERDRSTYVAIAHLLGYLPLAIVIAASRIACEPGWTASDFLARLLLERTRLSELDFEDESVRVAFGVSHSALSASDQRFFGTLGVFGGQDFSVEAAAFINEIPQEETLQTIRRLYALSLVECGRAQRYRLHPLVRTYALEQMAGSEVFRRMVEYYVVLIRTHPKAYNTIELEIGNILFALETGLKHQMWQWLIDGAEVLGDFWRSRGTSSMTETHWRQIYQAADQSGNTAVEVQALLKLGTIARECYQQDEAWQYLQQCEALVREAPPSEFRLELLANLGIVAREQLRYEEARGYHSSALEMARRLGLKKQAAKMLAALADTEHSARGWDRTSQGKLDQSELLYREALSAARECDDHETIIRCLAWFGNRAILHRNWEKAEDYMEEVEDCLEEILKSQIKIDDLNVLNQVGALAEDLFCRSARHHNYEGGLRWLHEIGGILRQMGCPYC